MSGTEKKRIQGTQGGSDIKGILFKPAMIPLIVSGKKTVTRRVIKPQLSCSCESGNLYEVIDWIGYKHEGKRAFFCHKCGAGLRHIDTWSAHGKMPRYQPGEVVYIREVFRLVRWIENPLLGDAIRPNRYEGLRIDIEYPDKTIKSFYMREWPEGFDKSHRLRNGDGRQPSPLFSPAWAARYHIKVLSVRAERLKDIGLSDIYAEGCPLPESTVFTDPMTGYENKAYAFEWYHDLWDSTNPDYPWEKNDWVFRYEFELTEQNCIQEFPKVKQ